MKKVIIILLVFVSFVITSLVSDVYAKDYSIESVSFVVNLNSDGSAEITEKRTYNFDGSFSWADEWIPLLAKCPECTNFQITDFSISENEEAFKLSNSQTPGTYSISLTKDDFYVKWYYKALNEDKTFTLQYTISNVIVNHTDISEFYWQLIGDEWSKGTGAVDATIFLPIPVPDDQVWAFGHGPLNGVVSIPTNERVLYIASSLPAYEFLEVRVLLCIQG